MMHEAPHEGLARFLALLDRRCRYAVVKNPDLWASLSRGGDWDLAVSDLSAAQDVLIEALGPPRRVARWSYVTAHYYDWGEIDLLPCLAWQGVDLIPLGRFLQHARRSTAGWLTAAPAHQAIMGWIAPILAYGRFPEKYAPVVREAMSDDPAELRFALHRLFGARLAEALYGMASRDDLVSSDALSRMLRRAARGRALARSPVDAYLSACRFAHGEVMLRLCPPLPFLYLGSALVADDVGRWCGSRRKVIPGLVVFDGSAVRQWTSGDAELERVGQRLAVSCRHRRLTVAERRRVAELQAAGWLAASTVAPRGVRGSTLAIMGRPVATRAAVAEYLDACLRRHANAGLSRTEPFGG